MGTAATRLAVLVVLLATAALSQARPPAADAPAPKQAPTPSTATSDATTPLPVSTPAAAAPQLAQAAPVITPPAPAAVAAPKQPQPDSAAATPVTEPVVASAPAPQPAAGAAAPAPAPQPAAETIPAAATAPAAQSASATPTTPAQAAKPEGTPAPGSACPKGFDTQKYRKTSFTDTLKTTVAIHPKRPSAKIAMGSWIEGRATHYGADDRLEAAHVACGEPAGQFGIIEQGSCGYTNSDGSLPFPKEMYAAVADTNEDYPGSCGRCYEVRCRTGAVHNNGRPLRVSDLQSYRPYDMRDSAGRDWPGNPKLEDDIFYTKCWDDSKVITVRVGDSCPCQYPIKETGEIRTQNWCCGGNNHVDLSLFAFEQLAHPSYGVMPIQYRPVACDSGAPLLSLPGFVNQTIYEDSIQAGWTWMPYNAKNTVLLAQRQGVGKSNATCGTLSQGGAMQFLCRQCSRPGYQPFAKAKTLRFDIRSNTKSADPFVSSTPPGELPALKVFLMNAAKGTYCGAEVMLSAESGYAAKASGDWYRVAIPLSAFGCDKGSAGGLAAIDRVDLQNVNLRDADICLDNIALK